LWLYFWPCAVRSHRNFHFEGIRHWLERSPEMRIVRPPQDQCERELYVIPFYWLVVGIRSHFPLLLLDTTLNFKHFVVGMKFNQLKQLYGYVYTSYESTLKHNQIVVIKPSWDFKGERVYTGWYWSLYRMIKTFVQDDVEVYKEDTEVYTGWYWSLCRVILKFIQDDTEVYRGLYWSLYRLILKFMQADTEAYTWLYWSFTRMILEFIQEDNEVFTGWYWSFYMLIMKFVYGFTEVCTG
jgi:hypothetical protein